jgi:hypothetical protein
MSSKLDDFEVLETIRRSTARWAGPQRALATRQSRKGMVTGVLQQATTGTVP